MQTEAAREWAQSFENKSESEILAMRVPLELSNEELDAWWLARERAIEALADAEESAGQSDAPEPASDAPDALVVDELALAREEQAQKREVVGRMSMFSDPAPVLDDIAPAFARPRAHTIRNSGDTEHLLNGLIAECHLLMRAVTLPSAMRAGDADTRRLFLESAMNIAKVGAKVGRAVAKLRGAGANTEIRQRHISERVYSGPAPFSKTVQKREFNGAGKPPKTPELAHRGTERQSECVQAWPPYEGGAGVARPHPRFQTPRENRAGDGGCADRDYQ